MKLYDPYKIIDPTLTDEPLPVQGRTYSGRYNGKSIFSNEGIENHWST